MPGTAGFVSKWYLVLGALEAGSWWLAFLPVASSLIAVVYVWRVLEVAWFREPVRQVAGCATRRSPAAAGRSAARRGLYFGLDTDAARSASRRAPPRPCSGAAMSAQCVDPGGRSRLPLVGRAAASPLSRRAPNLREAVTLPRRWRCSPSCATLTRAVLGGARPAHPLIDLLPGPRLAFEVEPLGHAVRARRLLAVDRQLDLLDRLHARQQRAAPDALLRLLRRRLGSTIGIAFANNLFTLFLFYEVLTLSPIRW